MASYVHNVLDVTPLMTSANAPSPCVVTADHEDSGSEGWRAFNHLYYPRWGTDQGYSVANPASVIFDLGEGNEKVVNSYTLTSGGDASVKWTIYGSNNNIDWDTLDTQTGGTAFNEDEMKTFSFSNSTPYRYYKLTQTGYDSYGGFGEIEYLGAPAPPEITSTLSLSPQLQGEIETPVDIFSLNSNISLSPQISGELKSGAVSSGTINVDLPSLLFSAYGGGVLNLTLPKLLFSVQGHVDPVGRLNITLPRLLFNAHAIQDELGALNMILPVLQFSAHGIVSGLAQLNIILPKLKFEAHGLNSVGGQLNVILPSLRFNAHAYWTGANTLNITLPKLQFSMRARSNDILTLVLNTKNFAQTEYDNAYNYNSLLNFNGKLVGTKRDGIYELNGDTDNGESIDWYFKTGKFDLEEGQLKKARYIWLSYRPSGDLILTVDDGENEYEYDVESYKQIDNAVRIKLGKGIRNRYIQLELSNVSNEKITLDRMRLFTEPIAKKR